MSMKIAVERVEGGYELTYQYGNGPVCFGPEGSTIYPTLRLASVAAERELAAARADNARGLSDAPHIDAN